MAASRIVADKQIIHLKSERERERETYQKQREREVVVEE